MCREFTLEELEQMLAAIQWSIQYYTDKLDEHQDMLKSTKARIKELKKKS